jgi:hypothetical protein
MVKTVALPDLLDQLRSDSRGREVLVLDVAGQECALLAALPPSTLRRFAWVAIRAPRQSLDGEETVDGELRQLLHKAGFRSVATTADVDPLFEVTLAEFDHARYEIVILQEQLEEQRRQTVYWHERHQEQVDQAAFWQRQSTDFERLLADRRQSIDGLTQELQSLVSRLEQVEKARDEARAAAQLAREHGEAIEAAREALAQELAQATELGRIAKATVEMREAEIAKLTDDVEVVRRREAALSREMQSLQVEMSRMEKETTELRDRLADAEEREQAAVAESARARKEATLRAVTADEAIEGLRQSNLQLESMLSTQRNEASEWRDRSEELGQRLTEAGDRAADLERQVAALQEALNRGQAIEKDRETEIDALRAALAGMEESAAVQKREVSRLEDELAASRPLLTAAEDELAEQRRQTLHWKQRWDTTDAQLLAAVRDAREAKTEVQQARRTVQLATQVNAMREADLAELRQRYDRAVSVQEQQHRLLARLEDKLANAALHFRQLQSVSTASVGDGLTAVEATKKPIDIASTAAKKRSGPRAAT